MNVYHLEVTTDASGDGTDTIAVPVSYVASEKVELLYAVEWEDGDLIDGVDAVLSCADTLSGVDVTLLTLTNANADAWYYPRELEDDNAGAALTTYCMAVVQGTLTLVVSSGGDTKTGGCYVYTVEV